MLCVVLGISLARQRIGAQLEFRPAWPSAVRRRLHTASPQKQGERNFRLDNCVETFAGFWRSQRIVGRRRYL